MGLFDLFGSKSKDEKYAHLRSLVALSLADGHISEDEKAVVADICRREGLSADDLKRAIEGIRPNEKHVFPTDDDTKVRYLMDMVCLMMIDGNIDEKELALCKVAARAMGFRADIIDAMMSDIIENVKKELNL